MFFKATYQPGISYSPSWHGTRDHDFTATVLLYNDIEGYCIGQTEAELTPDVTELTEAEVLAILGNYEADLANNELAEGIWIGQKLADRWLPEATHEEIEDTPETLQEASTITRTAVDTFLKTCPICHQNVAWVVKYDDDSVKIVQNGQTVVDGIAAKEMVLTCPAGHRVKVVCNG